MAATPLDAIQDQPAAVELLRRALAGGRVAHAWAFVGAPGSGRMTTALAFAAALLCERGGAHGPGAGACRGCALVAARQHPDLHVIEPTPPEGNPRGPRAIRIEAVREMERMAALKPLMARRKVFLMDEAERMTGVTPQAILKFLEEPPAGTHAVLVLPHVRAVPATVLSRCRLVRFRPRDAGRRAALLGDALVLLREVRARGLGALLRRAERLDRAEAEALADGCWLWCRDLLVARAGASGARLTDPAHAEAVAAEAERWSLDELLGAAGLCREARLALALNVTPRLTLEIVLDRLALRAA